MPGIVLRAYTCLWSQNTIVYKIKVHYLSMAYKDFPLGLKLYFYLYVYQLTLKHLTVTEYTMFFHPSMSLHTLSFFG